MNYVYPAIFYPETDGKYSVIFRILMILLLTATILPMHLSWRRKPVVNTYSPL